MRSRPKQQSPDQLSLFSLDDTQEPDAPPAPPADAEVLRPSSLREAIRRRNEAWEQRRADDPEGVAAEEAKAEVEAREALRLYRESSVHLRWIDNQAKSARIIDGSTLRTALDIGRAANLDQFRGVTIGLKAPTLSTQVGEQINKIVKGVLADYPSENLLKTLGEGIRLRDVISERTDVLTKGILKQYPSSNIAETLSGVVNANFTPAMAAQLSLIGSAATQNIGMQIASASPAIDTLNSTLRSLSTEKNESLRNILRQVGGGVTFPRGALLREMGAGVTFPRGAFDVLRLGAQPINTTPYISKVLAGALPLVQEQERLAALIRGTLASIPQSLIDELATLTDEGTEEGTEQPATLGNTNLLAPTTADLPLLEEEARRLGFPQRSAEAFAKVADGIIAVPSELAELYRQKETQRLIAVLLLYIAISTGNPIAFAAVMGTYYATLKPFLDHIVKGD